MANRPSVRDVQKEAEADALYATYNSVRQLGIDLTVAVDAVTEERADRRRVAERYEAIKGYSPGACGCMGPTVFNCPCAKRAVRQDVATALDALVKAGKITINKPI